MIIRTHFFFLIFLLSFTNSDTNSDYFEGVLIYEIDYVSKNRNLTNEKIELMIGSKMVVAYKNGNHKRTFYDPSGNLLTTRFLDIKKGISYSTSNFSDTIYWMNIRKEDSITRFKILNDTTIGKYKCKIIESKHILPENHQDPTAISYTSISIASPDLAINPEWYRQYKDTKFNEIVEQVAGIEIEGIFDGEYWVQRRRLRTVQRRKVKAQELEFTIPKNRPTKEL